MGTDRPFPRRHSDLRPSGPRGGGGCDSPTSISRRRNLGQTHSAAPPGGAAQHSPPHPCEVTAASDERKAKVNRKRALTAGHGVTPNPLPSRLVAWGCSRCYRVWATAFVSETARKRVSRSIKDSGTLREGGTGEGQEEAWR